MHRNAQTIRQLLNQELQRRSYISNEVKSVDDLFNREKVERWIKALIGKTKTESLATLINNSSTERLAHTAATYLLGVASRDRLRLSFDMLPKLVSNGDCDGFQFFWSLICLCHDLGYQFENDYKGDKDILRKMDTPEERMDLLKTDYDFLELDYAKRGTGNHAQNQWICESQQMISRYSFYRSQRDHTPEKKWEPVIDHGIAGACLLYDLLQKEHDQLQKNMKEDAARARELSKKLRHGEETGLLEGVYNYTSSENFLASNMMIACTVGRHNMWLASDDVTQRTYDQYGLSKLKAGRMDSKVRADSQQEQMLFFLDFMDTIDPVKGIYLRELEKAEERNQLKQRAAELEDRRSFMLDKVRIEFVGDYVQEKEWDSECHWGDALSYRKIEISADEDPDGFFKAFAESTSNLDEWLKTRAPEYDQANRKITYYMPTYRARGNCWPYGITDREVEALLLYEGCGVPGKNGEFYSPAEAYQTFNLLMMPGWEGEQVRVVEEGQNPRSIYIREWKKTLDVMTDIFSAQCKYAYHQTEADKKNNTVLFRSDRMTNLMLMEDHEGTFAFTSTSRDSFRNEFLKDKVHPQILSITLGEKIPYFDYEGFFGDQYAFSDEREVLLPPLLKMEVVGDTDRLTVEGETVDCHKIRFTGFDLNRPELGDNISEEALIDLLESNYKRAAAALDDLVKERNLTALDKKNHDEEKAPYWVWKEAFQKLTLRCMANIYKSYFGSGT